MCDSMSRTAGRLRSPGEGLDRRGPRQQEIRRMYLMSHIRRFDHVGITVADLDAATEFFVGLGLEVEGRMFMEGEFVDTVIGIPGSRSHIVMLRPPDGGPELELSSFVRPEHEPGSPTAMAAMANGLGLRNVSFEVDDMPRGSTGWLRTATAWSAASVSTRTSGAWPTFAGKRGLSFPWLSGSAEPAPTSLGVRPESEPGSVDV